MRGRGAVLPPGSCCPSQGAEGVSRVEARPQYSPVAQWLSQCQELDSDTGSEPGLGGCSPAHRCIPEPIEWALGTHRVFPCSPSSPPPRSPSSSPTKPQKEPSVSCVSCSSSEFYSAPLTLADRPQGKGQKDNCLQQFCPQLVSPSACRAAQPARHCLTNSIKFNSRCCERGGGAEETELLGPASFHAQNPKLQ